MSASPTPNFERLKEAQTKAWSDAETVVAWRKWYSQFVAQTREATDIIVSLAQPKPGMQVLDLASGSGEPALTLAHIVGSDGHVTATDLVSDMVSIAEENAQRAGLTNMTFKQADIESLEFLDQSFDVVTCRFGIIYCPDPVRALREMRRVLRPGGRVSLIAWGTPDQPYFSCMRGPFLKYAQLPPPEPGTPTPFQFAQPGSLSAAMTVAGFQKVHEETRTIAWPFHGSVSESWDYQREIGGAAFRGLFNSVPADKRELAVSEVLANLRQLDDGQKINFPAIIVAGTGIRG